MFSGAEKDFLFEKMAFYNISDDGIWSMSVCKFNLFCPPTCTCSLKLSLITIIMRLNGSRFMLRLLTYCVIKYHFTLFAWFYENNPFLCASLLFLVHRLRVAAMTHTIERKKNMENDTFFIHIKLVQDRSLSHFNFSISHRYIFFTETSLDWLPFVLTSPTQLR